MTMTDPIADMLTRIRNAIQARHTHVTIPASKMKSAILSILEREGYIGQFEIVDQQSPRAMLKVSLKYTDERAPVLLGLRRVSKPGLRVLRGKRRNSPGHGRHRHRHIVNFLRRYDRPRGLAAQNWRGSSLLRLVR